MFSQVVAASVVFAVAASGSERPEYLTGRIGEISNAKTEKLSSDFEPWMVNIELNNPTLNDISFLHYNTPLDDFTPCRHFKLYDMTDGISKEVIYSGPLAKRQIVDEDDWFTLKASTNTNNLQIDLSKCFEFEQDHQYKTYLDLPLHINFKFAVNDISKNHKDNFITHIVTENHHFTSKKSSHPNPRHKFVAGNQGEILKKKAVGFRECSSDETTIVNAAIVEAIDGLEVAYDNNILQGCANDDYTDFFGVYTPARYQRVTTNYENIQAKFNSENYNIDCGTCTSPGVYAYVYPTDTEYYIYLCSVFWDVSASLSIDSQPGKHKQNHL